MQHGYASLLWGGGWERATIVEAHPARDVRYYGYTCELLDGTSLLKRADHIRRPPTVRAATPPPPPPPPPSPPPDAAAAAAAGSFRRTLSTRRLTPPGLSPQVVLAHDDTFTSPLPSDFGRLATELRQELLGLHADVVLTPHQVPRLAPLPREPRARCSSAHEEAGRPLAFASRSFSYAAPARDAHNAAPTTCLRTAPPHRASASPSPWPRLDRSLAPPQPALPPRFPPSRLASHSQVHTLHGFSFAFGQYWQYKARSSHATTTTTRLPVSLATVTAFPPWQVSAARLPPERAACCAVRVPHPGCPLNFLCAV